jgi:hypothetical protein
LTLKNDLLKKIEETRGRFQQLLDSIPESDYVPQSGNAAWTVGDVLHHVTLGPRAIVFEAWMMLHARGLYQVGMRHFPSEWFNRVNAKFARREARRLSRAGLENSYENAHPALRSALMRVREQDFARSLAHPADLEPMIAGESASSVCATTQGIILRRTRNRSMLNHAFSEKTGFWAHFLWYNPARDWSCPTVAR